MVISALPIIQVGYFAAVFKMEYLFTRLYLIFLSCLSSFVWNIIISFIYLKLSLTILKSCSPFFISFFFFQFSSCCEHSFYQCNVISSIEIYISILSAKEEIKWVVAMKASIFGGDRICIGAINF